MSKEVNKNIVNNEGKIEMKKFVSMSEEIKNEIRKENNNMKTATTEKKNTSIDTSQRGIKFVTDKVVLHHTHLTRAYSFKESMPLKYSTSVIIHKEDTDSIDKLNAAIEEATKLGIERFGDKIQNPQNPYLPIRDGDDGTTGDIAYTNSFYFNTSTPIRPRIVNKKCVDETHDESYYEYRYARVSMNLIPYVMNDRLGISFRLNHVQIFLEKFDASQNISSPLEDFS